MIPRCSNHGDMEVVETTQGNKLLGFFWFCIEKECDECEDYDPAIYGERTPMFLDGDDVEEDEVLLDRETVVFTQLQLM